jgi:transposase
LITPTDVTIPSEVYNFTGQSNIDTWDFKKRFQAKGWRGYDKWSRKEIALVMQRIKELADSFPFWQRRKATGRKPIHDRDLLIAFLLRQFFNATFRRIEGIMILINDYFKFSKIPHHSVLSKYNRSKRWNRIWVRFHEFVMKLLPRREFTVITDASGYSGRKHHWRDVPYDVRSNQNWVKTHITIEKESLLILSYNLTESNVHGSKMFVNNWEKLPENVFPIVSLADGSYATKEICELVREWGAIPYHGVKSNAKCRRHPKDAYEKMVYYARHFPEKFKKVYSLRNLVETVFSMIDSSFGYRIRCRSDIGRKNEVHAKVQSHNLPMICLQNFMSRLV